MTLSASEVNQLKQAPANEKVLPAVLHRWSPRSFAEQDVRDDELKTLFEAARWAASSFNEQPWRFLVGKRGSATYQKIFDSLGEFNQAWAKSAPVLILGATRTKFSHNESPNSVALYDLGAAAATLCYQATSLGLFTHQMGGYDRDVARKLLDVPEDFIFGAVIALGHLGEPAALPNEQMRKQEVSPRERKQLQEFVWSGWNQAAEWVNR